MLLPAASTSVLVQLPSQESQRGAGFCELRRHCVLNIAAVYRATSEMSNVLQGQPFISINSSQQSPAKVLSYSSCHYVGICFLQLLRLSRAVHLLTVCPICNTSSSTFRSLTIWSYGFPKHGGTPHEPSYARSKGNRFVSPRSIP